MDMDQIIEYARAYRQQAGITRRQLAFRVGLGSDNTLRLMDEPGWNPTRKTLEAIKKFLPEGWKPGDPIPDTDETEAA